jgi:hypothetical protein
MSQPPPPDHGNVVDPDVLAARRARRAEVSEDASLELRLFDAERRLGEVAAERDALRAELDGRERDLRGTRQREWAEQQQRLEAQGEAAATRELAAGRLARLRERLAEAEAEVSLVSAERDRVREALERERAAAAVDRDRRAALEREHKLLRAELDRRAGLADAAASAIAGARQELVSARAAREDSAVLEQRLAGERATFASQVAAVESAVSAVRERLGAAAGVLRERLDGERAARTAAEAELASEREAARNARLQAAWLEGELGRRAEVEAQLRAALDALTGELAAVRAGDGARVARLAARVESVVGLAAGLRDGARRERDAEHEALTASLMAMQARVADLTAQVAAAAADREALEAERAARWVAEAELDAERRRGDDDRAARAAAEARLAEVEAELAELRDAARPSVVADPEALASLRDTLDQLRAVEPTAAPALGLDLAAAAARLRSMTPALGEPEAPAEVDAPAADPEAAAEPEAAMEPDPEPEPTRSALPAREPISRPGPWLRDALAAVAADEPDIAELLLVALLPAQAGLAKRPLTYDLAIAGGATHRVAIEDARVRVETPSDIPAGARVAGPLAALAPLAAGGAARRLPGTSIAGRRHLRRLLKARRGPLGLAELAAAGVAPSPGLLLTVLGRAVPARWTAGRPLAVDVAVDGADRWRVVASGDAPLLILPSSGDEPAPATLHVAAGRLPAVLAATAAADDAWVEGDPTPVRVLLGWLDRAQRA